LASPNQNQKKLSQRFSFAVLTLLFFMWGFITVMNDVLINTFKDLFTLSNFQSGLVQFSFFGAFFIISLIYYLISRTTGDPINRIGYKNGMVIGLAVCGLGCSLFYPAAMAGTYGFFLAALFVLASGVTILQIAANPYAAILGSPETASSRLNLAQGFNSLGTTIGPIVGALLIFMVFSTGNLSPESVGKTYLLYGMVFLVLAVVVKLLSMPAFVNDEQIEKGLGALKFSQLRFGIIAIFMYVGAEVAIGSWLVTFFESPDVMNMPKTTGNKFLAYYWGGLMIGRLLGAVSLSALAPQTRKWLLMAAISLATFAFIYLATSLHDSNGVFYFEFLSMREVAFYLLLLALNYIGFMLGKSAPARTLAVFALINVALLLTGISTTGSPAFWAIIGTGLFNSIMWSNIFTLAIKDLGKYTSQGSSLLIMAIVGGAIIPPAQGLLADYVGIQLSYLIPVIPYLYLCWYGLKGYKPTIKA
jgi:MFS transporter, FHS family, L-fucose permease